MSDASNPAAELSEAERLDFGVIVTAFAAGRCDGQQTLASIWATVERILAARLAAAVREALCAARDDLYAGLGPDLYADADIVYGEWLGNRADRITEPVSHEGHEFRPVAGHPDDDECTHRADGTDATYCGEPRASHEAATSGEEASKA